MLGLQNIHGGGGNWGLQPGGYSNNTERFGTFVKRGIIVIGNMVIQPPCPLSFGKKHAGPLDRLDPDR